MAETFWYSLAIVFAPASPTTFWRRGALCWAAPLAEALPRFFLQVVRKAGTFRFSRSTDRDLDALMDWSAKNRRTSYFALRAGGGKLGQSDQWFQTNVVSSVRFHERLRSALS